MRDLLPKLTNLTPGERCQLWAYLTVALFGMAFGLIVVLRLDPAALFSRGLTMYEYWIVLSGALGVCSALRLSRERLGLPGLTNTIIGMGMVTFAGAILAGTFALPLYGTMFAPFVLFIVFWVAPIAAALWFASLIGVHFMMQQWHAERDSIFGPHQRSTFRFVSDMMKDVRIR